MRLPLILGWIFLAAACVPTEPASTAGPEASKKFEVSAELVQLKIDYEMAGYLVKQCRKRLGLRYLNVSKVNAELARKYGNNLPWVKRELSAATTNLKAQEYLVNYIQRRKIQVNNQQTWCAAGLAEIAEGTGIGQFLVAL